MRRGPDTVQRKLMRALLATSMAVLAVTCSVFITYEYVTFRKSVVRGLATRGEIIAANSTAALAFQNEADARGVLSALRVDPHMVGACLYDREGRVFARYPADAPTASFPAAPQLEGSRFEGGHVVVFLPVAQGDRRLGTVYLKSDLSAMNQRFRLYAVLVAFVVAGSLAVAYALSVRLQKRVSGPVLDLARTARSISEQKDYALRARKQSDDEIGQLTDSFNDMLAQIQEREAALRKTEEEIRKLNVELEQRVADRTEQLEESRGQLASILENMGEGVVVADEGGNFVVFNPAAERMLGIGATATGPAEWAKTYGVFLPDRVTPSCTEDQPLFRAIQGESCDDVELFIRNPGVPAGLSISVSGRPIHDAEGGIRGGVVVFRDITERKRAQEEIQKLNMELHGRVEELGLLNQELEAFSYSVSHDLRAPLRHITGFSELLEKSSSSSLDEKGRRYLATISEAAKQMGRLVDDLLGFSRMGRVEMRQEPVDLKTLAQEVRRDVEREVSGRQVLWNLDGLPQVRGDPAMLRQVLVNLLSNALKYSGTRARSEVQMGSFVEGEEDVIFVRDNGVGFDMKYAEKLFGVFQRLHRAEEFEGTGIGLANVRRIIHRHGGRTWAEGAVGAGATFYFSLPRLEEVPG